MYANAIPLREKLDFQQYQKAVKALLNIGIQIAEPEEDDFYYDLSAEELKKIERARELSKLGMTISSEELHREMIERYGSKMKLRG